MGVLRVVAGRWRGRHLSAGPARGQTAIRPTADRVRTSLFDRLMPILSGARVLDLCAGTGALGIEALSRGAAHVTFVDRSGAAIRLIEGNLESLGLKGSGEASVRRDEAVHAVAALARQGEKFDLVLADPPYAGEMASSIVLAMDDHPILAEDGWFLLEHDRRITLPKALRKIEPFDQRQYGDTCLTFYRESRDEDSPLSGDL
ncbi:MAG TPA: 16S rRNA (guanine(966)-N(2))-methyltransferase RsmD [Candidatus Eisenbacteria bacterium]